MQQNYSDEEYYYDEDDLTVKPLIIKSTTTTKKPYNDYTTTTTPKELISTTPIKAETSTTNHSILTTIITAPPIIPTITTSTTNMPITTPKDNKIHVLNSYSSSYLPAFDTKPRSKVEPIYAIEEPILQPKRYLKNFNYGLPSNTAQSREGSYSVNEAPKLFKNSRIYKVKVHRSEIEPQVVRCRANQYRDARGNCRRKRDSSSASIL